MSCDVAQTGSCVIPCLPPPSVSLCASVLESPWLLTWIRFDTLVHCSPEQNKQRPTSPLHPQKVTCVATLWAGKNLKEETGAARDDASVRVSKWDFKKWKQWKWINRRQSCAHESTYSSDNTAKPKHQRCRSADPWPKHQQMMKIRWKTFADVSIKFKSYNLQKDPAQVGETLRRRCLYDSVGTKHSVAAL